MTLLARVELMPDELTQLSFVSRLAAVSGCPTAAQFCRETGLDWVSIRKGRREALVQLADLSGADINRLRCNAITEVAQRSFELRGCQAVSNMFRTDEYALCPACIANDLENGAGQNPYDRVYLRIGWHLRAIETCHLHHLRLIAFPLNNVRYEKRDFASFGWDAAYQLVRSGRPIDVQPATPFELYLIERLDGGVGSTWLDNMPMSEVTRLCETFGTAILTGDFRCHQWGKNSPSEIRDAGFQILKTGPEAMHQFLKAKLENLGEAARFTGIRKILGPAVELLATRENRTTGFLLFRHEIRTFSEAHLLDTALRISVPFSAGPFKLEDLAKRTGLSINTLRRAMARMGLDMSEDAQIDTVIARRIVREARRLWTNSEVRSTLGVSNAILWVLANEGLLGPVHRGQCFKANRRFEPAIVEGLLENAYAAAISTKSDSMDWISLSEAAARYRCGIAAILRLLLGGSVRKVFLNRAEPGLAGIRLCAQEVFTKLFGVEWRGLSMRQCARRLGTTFKVIAALLERGAIVHWKSEEGAGSTVYVSERSLQEFQDRYISLANLARSSGKSPRRLNKELAGRSILPAITRQQCGASFFRRDDILLPH